MDVLVICDFFPWPEKSGGRIRVANVVRALARLGSVDVFAIATREREATAPEEVARFGTGPRPLSRYRRVDRLRWLMSRRLPAVLATRDYGLARSAFTGWARPRYDLVWFRGAESYVALGDLINAPTIVDLDDLEDQKLESRLQNVPRGTAGTGSWLRSRIDSLERWRRAEAGSARGRRSRCPRTPLAWPGSRRIPGIVTLRRWVDDPREGAACCPTS